MKISFSKVHRGKGNTREVDIYIDHQLQDMFFQCSGHGMLWRTMNCKKLIDCDNIEKHFFASVFDTNINSSKQKFAVAYRALIRDMEKKR